MKDELIAEEQILKREQHIGHLKEKERLQKE